MTDDKLIFKDIITRASVALAPTPEFWYRYVNEAKELKKKDIISKSDVALIMTMESKRIARYCESIGSDDFENLIPRAIKFIKEEIKKPFELEIQRSNETISSQDAQILSYKKTEENRNEKNCRTKYNIIRITIIILSLSPSLLFFLQPHIIWIIIIATIQVFMTIITGLLAFGLLKPDVISKKFESKIKDCIKIRNEDYQTRCDKSYEEIKELQFKPDSDHKHVNNNDILKLN